SRKIAMAAAALAVLVSSGAASAAPWDHDHNGWNRHQGEHFGNRHPVERGRVFETLRSHHYRNVGDPYFVRGHYVVRSQDRFGRITFVEVDPWSGAFVGEFRL
ncbi:MAG TPA: hypothetical protein VIJ72_00160, partial [Rhizomicrobium sp.]